MTFLARLMSFLEVPKLLIVVIYPIRFSANVHRCVLIVLRLSMFSVEFLVSKVLS